jgi:hypothetical protein
MMMAAADNTIIVITNSGPMQILLAIETPGGPANVSRLDETFLAGGEV